MLGCSFSAGSLSKILLKFNKVFLNLEVNGLNMPHTSQPYKRIGLIV
jgi:hypothetical protein